eukprot:1772411-Rhodomonas_salina.3
MSACALANILSSSNGGSGLLSKHNGIKNLQVLLQSHSIGMQVSCHLLRPVHPKIKLKKPHFQYNLNQERVCTFDSLPRVWIDRHVLMLCVIAALRTDERGTVLRAFS